MTPDRTEERIEIKVAGTVQGVGFRPFVHNLATRLGLAGQVRNTSEGVAIEVQGPPDRLREFLAALSAEAPGQARIGGIETRPLPTEWLPDPYFHILDSRRGGGGEAAIPPDLATCEECLAEIGGSRNRRYRYAFTNCTRCGPRFTVVTGLPYDRPATTMAGFRMCPECGAEYEEPEDRRFHAQPIACPVCGPRLTLLAVDQAAGSYRPQAAVDPLAEAAATLERGGVVALKSLGGFQLACLAANATAVARVRELKHRPEKPLAIICRDLAQAGALCYVDLGEEAALTGAAKPIVLLRQRPDCPPEIAVAVAPGQDTLGIMLPYTPLHQLLLEQVAGPLVMTSANREEEPMALTEAEIPESIRRGLDLVLTHDRPIAARCDDSVIIAGPERIMIRRARGYVPAKVDVALSRETLGIGGDGKNTACFLRRGQAVLTQHLGDLESAQAQESLREMLAHFQRLFGFAPEAIGADLHPGYISTAIARTLGPPVTLVQHHHAHTAACLAENGVRGEALGVAFDGTGYGPDGTIWGGEFLSADYRSYSRVGALGTLLLPGGELAVREPWRLAVAALFSAFGSDLPDFPGADPLYARGADLLVPMIRAGINCPVSSSAGRLFDAVGALLGLFPISSFEGQAAMALEVQARRASGPPPFYEFGRSAEHALPRLDYHPVVQAIARDLAAGVAVPAVALGFHEALARGVRLFCEEIRSQTGLSRVALSGGVFQNRLLLQGTRRELDAAGFTVLAHREVPPNDGGISLGQAVVASARLEGGHDFCAS